MKLRSWILLGAALSLTCPAWAATYYGGFEDRVSGDYDYNDIVFSLTGNGLTLNTSDGHWFPKPTLGTSGSPFWNRSSVDGANRNVGYCVYGGGNCGAGLDPNAHYLATNSGGSVDDVYFTIGRDQDVSTEIELKISSDTDKIGFYLLSSPGSITWFAGSPGSTYTFDPHGRAFGIAGKDLTTGDIFYSTSNWPNDPNRNHFAWFDDPVSAPEPSVMGLMAGGLVGVGLLFRRKKLNTNN